MHFPSQAFLKTERLAQAGIEKDDIVFPAAADRLSQFTCYRFYTPALLYLYGQFNEMPLLDFEHFVNQHVSYMQYRFQQPLFRGLEDPGGDVGWNYTLWAMPAELWDAFESFMLSVTTTDSVAHRMHRTAATDLKIPDPLWCQRNPLLSPAQAPLADIVAFGVDSSNMAVALVPGPPGQLPRRSIYPPRDRTRRMASVLFGDTDPVAAVSLLTSPVTEPRIPINFRTCDIQQLDAGKRKQYEDAIEAYKKEGFKS